jgi:hypothetical protein
MGQHTPSAESLRDIVNRQKKLTVEEIRRAFFVSYGLDFARFIENPEGNGERPDDTTTTNPHSP